MSRSMGFSGTRDGCTDKQLIRLAGVLSSYAPYHAHHGDCIGADDQFAHMAYRMGCEVIGHPPINQSKRAFSPYTHIWRAAKDYLPRNRDIVDESNLLVATPKDYSPEARSGTWATIRYAQKLLEGQVGLIVYVIYPDGSVQTDVGKGLRWEGS